MNNVGMPAEILSQANKGAPEYAAIKTPAHPMVISALCALFLVSHFVAIHAFPSHAEIFSLIFQVAAPLIAAVACFLRGRTSYPQGWHALGLALLLWSGGLAINLLDVIGLPNPEPGPSLSVMLSILYGVPIVFSISSPIQEVLPVRLVDGILALSAGILFYVHSFTFTSTAAPDSADYFYILLAFDVENLLIALFACVRFFSSHEEHEKQFFGTLAMYAILYMLAAGGLNHFYHEIEYGVAADLLIDIPFLALAATAAGWRRGVLVNYSLTVSQERMVLAVSPLMLPALLLAVSAIVFTANPLSAMIGFAIATLVSGLRNVLTHLRNLEERDRLAQLAQIDTLTGLPNRRSFDDKYRQEWLRARRAQSSIAVLMIDIDHFKILNDGLGHAEGDRCLRLVAEALGDSAMRASDLIARYGGEEFVAVLPGASAEQALQFAIILGQKVRDLDLHSPGPIGRVTISVGIGQADITYHSEPAALLKAADDALYEAKRSGRNTQVLNTL
jgi:diguanylate cyclase (GGDEF)-like protein